MNSRRESWARGIPGMPPMPGMPGLGSPIRLYISIYVYVYMSICLYIYLSICLSIYLSIYLYMYIYIYIYTHGGSTCPPGSLARPTPCLPGSLLARRKCPSMEGIRTTRICTTRIFVEPGQLKNKHIGHCCTSIKKEQTNKL